MSSEYAPADDVFYIIGVTKLQIIIQITPKSSRPSRWRELGGGGCRDGRRQGRRPSPEFGRKRLALALGHDRETREVGSPSHRAVADRGPGRQNVTPNNANPGRGWEDAGGD
jgi:hypothetical protein